MNEDKIDCLLGAVSLNVNNYATNNLANPTLGLVAGVWKRHCGVSYTGNTVQWGWLPKRGKRECATHPQQIFGAAEIFQTI